MISAGEFRNGITFDMDGQVLQIVEFQHVKPGKGAAFVRTKLKNVITGAVVDALWLLNLSVSTGIYEILPGFIAGGIAALVVSLLTKAPGAEVEAIFAAATNPDVDD